jgi:hypothetical protein
MSESWICTFPTYETIHDYASWGASLMHVTVFECRRPHPHEDADVRASLRCPLAASISI